MIHWKLAEPDDKLTDLLGIEKPKDMTLESVLEVFSSSKDLRQPAMVRRGMQRILRLMDGKRSILTIRVKDGNKIYDEVAKKEHTANAYRARAVLANAVNYALTGTMPDIRSGEKQTVDAPTAEGEEDIGKMRFSKAKLADVLKLVPLYSGTGRFGWIKAEVQTLIHSLAADEAGIIEAPKRAMNPKEAKSINTAVTTMFTKARLPWTIRYNQNEKVFIILRKDDFNKLMNKKGE